jgi:two-component system chemotaxis response regulator CheB
MSKREKRELRPGERVRVLVVDDSVVIRRLVSTVLEEEPRIEVVGVASNGKIALDRVNQFAPDVITLDVEMPEMDGLMMLRELRKRDHGTRVIMFSTLTERCAATTIEALSLGADDYVTKASNEGSLDQSLQRLRGELLPKIFQFFAMPGENGKSAMPAASASGAGVRTEGSVQAPPRTAVAPPSALAAMFPTASVRAFVRPKAVVIGVSTGGPAALGEILPSIPAGFPTPILVVQHMPPMFTGLLAERLNSLCQIAVSEARDGDRVEAGRILIAPGDYHMKLQANGKDPMVRLDQGPPENSCRPAVDVLFRSAVDVYQGALLGVVLTGMGYDGLRGSEVLKAAGATVIAQDEGSSVVWGMPGAVAGASLADRVLPLDSIVPEILRIVGRN